MNSVLRSIDFFVNILYIGLCSVVDARILSCFFQTPYICVCYLALFSQGTCLAFSLHFLDLMAIQPTSAYVITDHRKHVSMHYQVTKSLIFSDAQFLCIHIHNSMNGSPLTIIFKQNSLLKKAPLPFFSYIINMITIP